MIDEDVKQHCQGGVLTYHDYQALVARHGLDAVHSAANRLGVRFGTEADALNALEALA